MAEMIETAFGRFTPRSGRRVNLTGDYESCALKSFRDVAEVIRASLIIDVGANVGVYSVFTASLPEVEEVHAFEPEDDAFIELTGNIALHPEGMKITSHQVALSDTEGTASLKIVEPMHGMNAVQAFGAGGQPVALRSLDATLPIRGRTACLKVDVEGHELKVLAGASSFLRNNPCYLQVECLESVAAAEALLSAHGYSLLLVLNHDCLFLHRDLGSFKGAILARIYENLAADLMELTRLRVDARARRRARRAEQLRQLGQLS